MWCRQCQQDVPVLASSDEGKSCCPRCGLELGTIPIKRKPAPTTSADETTDTVPLFPLAELEDWVADEQLRRIERQLKINKKSSRRPSAKSAENHLRIDAAHGELAPARQRQSIRARSNASYPRRLSTAYKRRSPEPTSLFVSAILTFLTRLSIFLGIASLLGGGIALGGSMLSHRQDLWNYGLPFAVGGQIVLLVGLVLQLDRVWRENRSAAAKLDEVDEELHDLKTTAVLLGTSQSPSASSFYAHYAGGANAQLLLTDLKSQLDMLAIKIANEDDR